MGEPIRLTPQRRSRKLIALDFIKRYFAEYDGSPSLSEIAAALNVSRQRANELVHQLSDEHKIRHRPGKPRGIELIEQDGAHSQAEALLTLRALGWKVLNDSRIIEPAPIEIAPPLTKAELPNLPILDHDPERDEAGS